ncbi:MAG: dihydroorotate dehydrogenase electron transfer subunit [Coriobacteriia bacterium]|nr:dihydroorotate dehydrogenase electron transfer subunit [Coriobacteriia bacterium]
MCKCNNQKVVGEARIVENSACAPNTFTLVLEVPKELAECVQPGQFVELNLRQPDLVLPRPISIYAVLDSCIELRYQLMGEGTKRLSQMPVGTLLGIFGPLGNRWPVPEAVKSALLIGGGIGSAPLAMLADELSNAGIRTTMVQAARSADLLIADDHFEWTCSEHCLATDDGSSGHHGLITEPLAEVLNESSFDIAYICGPEPMQEACAALTMDAGIETYVSLERMMACGVGACLTCVVPTANGLKRVCADGPIFNAREVDWHEARSSRIH